MNISKCIFTLILAITVFGFFLLSHPKNADAGMDMLIAGCCQLPSSEVSNCGNYAEPLGLDECLSLDGDPIQGESCNNETGLCSGSGSPSSVPTISEWGLIATAVFMGIVGYFVIRRRKAVV